MRAGTASQHERLMRLFRRNADRSAEAGLTGIHFSGVGDGSSLEIDGRLVANFGSCSYLGLAVDERLKEGAKAAIDRFGALYSSSQAYAAVDLYEELEELMMRMTDAAGVVLPPTTTLGHLSILPTLVGDGDALALDAHSHASLQLTVQVLAGRGIPIHPIQHDDKGALESTIDELASSHRRVWYVADGVYSMFGDLAPLPTISGLMEQHQNLHLYLDDAHGFSWLGRHGRGYVLSEMPWSERLVVAVGLAKSFGSGGGALFFGDADRARTVRALGGPMTFAGPIHPPTLGAAVASAKIHLSPEHVEMRRRMSAQIDLVATQMARHRLPVVSWARTPIWLVRVGDFDRVLEIARRMLVDGFYLNVSAFPAVPVGQAGLRFTHTLRNTDDQIVDMLERLAHHLREVVGDIDSMVDLDEFEMPGDDKPDPDGSESARGSAQP
ncbi:MAG: aminotransferase class I/II-fold pyridoxal phosphate-dependent enzyme [Acidimicrobiia bacterium]